MNTDIIDALKQIEKERSIPLDVLLEAIESALQSAYKKNFGTTQNISVEIDRETGETKVHSVKTVVAKVKDKNTEISLAEARKIKPKIKVDETISIEITPSDFGRIAAQTARQVIIQRIREAERDIAFAEYADRVDDIISGMVQRYEQKNLLLEIGKVEAIVPVSELTPIERFRHGDRVKIYILDVKNVGHGPQITGSRTHPNLLIKLFELEVPEIIQKIVEIKSAAREPGSRSKISVSSNDPNVDPVGACVGSRGSRVKSIVEELHGEKIDIVHWNKDPVIFISNSLSPAKVAKVILYEHNKFAYVVVPDDQLSLAIGKEGQNARLAAKLTGWKIDIKSETQSKEKPPPPMPTPEELEALKKAAEEKKAKEEAKKVKKAKKTAQVKEEKPLPEAPAEEIITAETPEILVEKTATAPTPETEQKSKDIDKLKRKRELELEEKEKVLSKPKKKRKKLKRPRYENEEEEDYSQYLR